MGLRRVFDILDIEPDVQDRADAKPMQVPEISFDDVTGYENRAPCWTASVS